MSYFVLSLDGSYRLAWRKLVMMAL